jgi:hypothetical protein
MVEMLIDEINTGRGAPMPEKTVFDVLWLEWLSSNGLAQR